MASNFDVTGRDGDDRNFSISTPLIFLETFTHPIYELVERFGQWHTFLNALQKYFECKKATAESLCDYYGSAGKSFEQRLVSDTVLQALEPPKSKLQRLKYSFNKMKDRFFPLLTTKNFEFDFVKDGGVISNVKSLETRADSIAILEDKHRVYLVNVTLSALFKVKEMVEEQRKSLDEWCKGMVKAVELQKKAITAYHQLLEAKETYVKGGGVPTAPQHDPHFRWQEYQSLRHAYIASMNSLQQLGLVRTDECKKAESEIVASIENIVRGYLEETREHNRRIRSHFSSKTIPFDAKEEWEHFTSNNIHVSALPPGGPPRYRNFRFANDQHPLTCPLAEASLLLHRRFPWSLRSQYQLRKYVVTSGGFLIKLARDGKQPPLPRRAFRLADCNIVVHETNRFVIYGMNCCRTFTSQWTDLRSEWMFTGQESQVVPLLKAIKRFVPAFRYSCIPL